MRLLGQELRKDLGVHELQWEQQLLSHELTFLQCHRVGKVPLLPGATYAAFVKSMPIVCVDVLLTRNSDGAALLVLRHSEPVRGLHWFPGGRLLFGETFTEAALRKVRALQAPSALHTTSLVGSHCRTPSFWRQVRKEIGLSATGCRVLGT